MRNDDGCPWRPALSNQYYFYLLIMYPSVPLVEMVWFGLVTTSIDDHPLRGGTGVTAVVPLWSNSRSETRFRGWGGVRKLMQYM